MKLAITGKGGVGKTTLSSLLARVYAQEGRTVLAIDADPDANLASALGFSPEEFSQIIPVSEMAELIEERTGAKPGTTGGFFKINPRVDDIPDRFSASRDGVKLLIMGGVKKGGGGCICPESVLLRSLVTHLILYRKDVVIMDMEAGIEHLGRATAQSVDAFIVVVEPGQRSFQTARSIRTLAGEIGIERCFVVGSKVRGEDDRKLIADSLPDFTMLGFLSFSPLVQRADMLGQSVYDIDPGAAQEAREIVARLENTDGG
ncbi:MAG: carbon monoxide dehydrogenase accessory protein CooC [Dehalococcoidia bacterium]|nr:carbon monoxide dehydrogenase accessory protein CooC [Dehalococcoidia bacterium]